MASAFEFLGNFFSVFVCFTKFLVELGHVTCWLKRIPKISKSFRYGLCYILLIVFQIVLDALSNLRLLFLKIVDAFGNS